MGDVSEFSDDLSSNSESTLKMLFYLLLKIVADFQGLGLFKADRGVLILELLFRFLFIPSLPYLLIRCFGLVIDAQGCVLDFRQQLAEHLAEIWILCGLGQNRTR